MGGVGDRVVQINATVTVRERAKIKLLAAEADRRQQDLVGDLIRAGLVQLQSGSAGRMQAEP